MTSPSGQQITGPRYLSESDVAALAPAPGELANRLAIVFGQRAEGRIQMPPKANLSSADADAFYHVMPALVPGTAAGVKWAAGSPANSSRGLPHIHSLVLLSDLATGRPTAIIEANHLTGIRTAAISLLAARHLARKNAQHLAVIGCGLQATIHLDALCAEFPLRTVAIHGRRSDSMQRFARHAATKGLIPQCCTDPAEALRQADIVVSSVPAHPGLEGFLDARALPPGALAVMVDLGRSWRADTLAAFDSSFTDDLEQSRALSGNNPAFASMRFSGDLGALVGGGAVSRRDDTERLAFLFPGVAFADIVVGQMLLERSPAA